MQESSTLAEQPAPRSEVIQVLVGLVSRATKAGLATCGPEVVEQLGKLTDQLNETGWCDAPESLKKEAKRVSGFYIQANMSLESELMPSSEYSYSERVRVMQAGTMLGLGFSQRVVLGRLLEIRKNHRAHVSS